jgi:thiol-disulfide isomerase/thioredoxin
MNLNKKLIVSAIVVLVLIVAGAVYFYSKPNESQESGISSQQAGEKLISFINTNILRGQGEASLIGTADENGVYKVKFNVNDQEVEWVITKDGNFVFPQIIDLTEIQEPINEAGKTIGNFSVSSEDVCMEDGKPIVYFFGSESCPHCVWEKPILRNVMSNFDGLIAYHENIDTENDADVFEKYSTGGIPVLVFGCKYYRVGSGEGAGEEQEAKDLTALACKLTDGNPGEVCDQVKDITETIE